MGLDGTRTMFIVFAGIVGWYFLLRRTRAMEQNSEAAEQNATIAERGAVNEQLVRATKQISSKSPAVRTGGILKLEQVALSHGEEKAKIFRILTAGVCELAVMKSHDEEPVERNRRQDIEVAIRVVSRFAKSYLDELDLDSDELALYGDLQKTDLRGLELMRCFLSNFQLQGADLGKANLRLADLGGANLERARLNDAELEKVDLSDAILIGVVFGNANLKDTILHNADISDAELQNAKNLTQEALNQAYYVKGHPPRIPHGLNPPQERQPEEDQEWGDRGGKPRLPNYSLEIASCFQISCHELDSQPEQEGYRERPGQLAEPRMPVTAGCHSVPVSRSRETVLFPSRESIQGSSPSFL